MASDEDAADRRRSRLWYVRRAGRVRGPFPAGQIAREILLGRIVDGDELSHDREHWQPLAALPELVPEVLRHADTEAGRERLRLARLHEDERAHDRRHEVAAGPQARRGRDRRHDEPAAVVAHRERVNRWAHERPAPERNRALLAATVAVALAVLLVYAFYRPDIERAVRDCGAPPAAGVNWNSCDFAGRSLNRARLARANLANARLLGADLGHARLDGADLGFAILEGADLRGAVLTGASLRGAILRRARLAGADLRDAELGYADLTGAELAGTRLTGARLDKAIWVDGRVCADGSVGACR